MKDCKVLYVVNFSLIAQQIYNKLVECTVEYFVRWFVVIYGGLWWFAVVCGISVDRSETASAKYRQIEFHRRYTCFHSVDLSTSYKEV